jgi:hypothetical protein
MICGKKDKYNNEYTGFFFRVTSPKYTSIKKEIPLNVKKETPNGKTRDSI